MESQMDWRLMAASAVVILIAVAHSALGERRILGPLLKRMTDFGPQDQTQFVRLTLRFAWHLTSLFLLGCAAILGVVAFYPLDVIGLLVIETIGALFIASAAITASYSAGRHAAWPLFALAGLLCWWVAAWHEGGSPVAVSAILLLAAATHAYWASGGPYGLSAVVPDRGGKLLFRLGRIGTALLAFGLLAAALLVAEQTLGFMPAVSSSSTAVGCWILAALLLLRTVGDFRYVGLFKRVKDTAFAYWDTAAYTPLCLLLGVATVFIAR
jgi:hypothetical protein